MVQTKLGCETGGGCEFFFFIKNIFKDNFFKFIRLNNNNNFLQIYIYIYHKRQKMNSAQQWATMQATKLHRLQIFAGCESCKIS